MVLLYDQKPYARETMKVHDKEEDEFDNLKRLQK